MRSRGIAIRCIGVWLVYALTATQASGHEKQEHHGAGAHAGHTERTLDVPPESAPTLSVSLQGAAHRGFDMRMETTNFRFAPGHAEGSHSAGEGQALLYVNGEKIRQIFESSTRLPELSPGVHEIRVALFTNDDAGYAVKGVPVSQRFVVKVTAKAVEGEAAPARRFVLQIAGDRVRPSDRTLRVSQGDVVELRLSSSEPQALHLHGYDIETTVTPTDPVTMRFVATITGRFPLALHGHGGGHRHHALLYVEVHPR